MLYKQAVAAEPKWVPALHTLGRAQLNYGEPALARDSLARAAALAPDDAEVRTELAEAVLLVARLAQEAGAAERAARVAVTDTAEDNATATRDTIPEVD